jgi:hypothetical protein
MNLRSSVYGDDARINAGGSTELHPTQGSGATSGVATDVCVRR